MEESIPDRDKAERPVIQGLQETQSAEERFQNEVLRPVLKMKHESLVLLMKDFLVNHHIDLSRKDLKKRTEILTHVLSTNKNLKVLFLGLVIGQFTQEELEVYLSNKGPLNKRIRNLLVQRICSAALSF